MRSLVQPGLWGCGKGGADEIHLLSTRGGNRGSRERATSGPSCSRWTQGMWQVLRFGDVSLGCWGRRREGAREQTGREPGLHGVWVKDTSGAASAYRWCVRW